ncbi:zinc-binding alcohol dehydrogenase family protein [Levilactobacillus zymae]|uniref:zinc-binding alcohol dehydrogenase family protein n=1 Tax=Levilactobacillus zymae TaxID=267363 RepID=UPI0028B74557|nr:zinc-binding alcohol dehydrogenase family protein [Levilactobacillus zymae]MDT6980511.1 zinc-binding alcohol dehydrogenase family protein [Levilactobacillus zymae]
MHAIGYTQHLPLDDPHGLVDFDLPQPTPLAHDLLVQVTAISVNPVDLAVRGNHDPLDPQHPTVIGWDAYGTVTAVGSAVTLFQPGDLVFYAGSFKRPGSNSEYQLVDERLVGHAPTKLTPAQSAAMPLTSLTAWEALFEQLGIDPHADNHGQTLLVINGAGGVGSVATQLAHWAGLTVIATASRPETSAWTRDHGSDAVVNHREDLVPQVRELGYQYVDYVLELSNLNQHWPEIVDLIKPSGHIVSITGSDTPIDLRALKDKRATFAWEWMYTKSYFETPDMISQHQILEKVRQLLDEGTLRSTLTQTIQPINAENLMAAHKLVGSHHMMGKVVLQK